MTNGSLFRLQSLCLHSSSVAHKRSALDFWLRLRLQSPLKSSACRRTLSQAQALTCAVVNQALSFFPLRPRWATQALVFLVLNPLVPIQALAPPFSIAIDFVFVGGGPPLIAIAMRTAYAALLFASAHQRTKFRKRHQRT